MREVQSDLGHSVVLSEVICPSVKQDGGVASSYFSALVLLR